MRFMVTFGQKYAREHHPRFASAHPDNWVEILAPNETAARKIAYAHLGEHWAFIYEADDFNAGYFPGSCVATWSS